MDVDDDMYYKGVKDFNTEEMAFTEKVIANARSIKDHNMWFEAKGRRLAFLMLIMDSVDYSRKENPDVVTTRVHSFLMPWLSGATHFVEGNSPFGYLVAFICGVATPYLAALLAQLVAQ